MGEVLLLRKSERRKRESREKVFRRATVFYSFLLNLQSSYGGFWLGLVMYPNSQQQILSPGNVLGELLRLWKTSRTHCLRSGNGTFYYIGQLIGQQGCFLSIDFASTLLLLSILLYLHWFFFLWQLSWGILHKATPLLKLSFYPITLFI